MVIFTNCKNNIYFKIKASDQCVSQRRNFLGRTESGDAVGTAAELLSSSAVRGEQ